MKPIDLTKAKHIGVTVPVIWLAALVGVGFFFQPWLVKTFDLMTGTAYAADQQKLVEKVAGIEANQVTLQTAVDGINTKLDFSTALGYLRGLQSDLRNHRANPQNTPEWRLAEQQLVDSTKLADRYANCIRKKEQGCALLLEQLTPALFRNPAQ